MSDSPGSTIRITDRFFPRSADPAELKRAIEAQARHHETGMQANRATVERVAELEDDMRDVRVAVEEIKLTLAKASNNAARLSAWLTMAGVVVAAVISLVGNYLMRPSPEPPQRLSPDMLEAIRLYEQRTGHKLGQRPPGGEPVPFVAPAAK